MQLKTVYFDEADIRVHLENETDQGSDRTGNILCMCFKRMLEHIV